MTLNKNKMVREIGRRTRLKNRDVQFELENLFVLEAQTIDRGEQRGVLSSGGDTYLAPRLIRRLTVRASKRLKSLLNEMM